MSDNKKPDEQGVEYTYMHFIDDVSYHDPAYYSWEKIIKKLNTINQKISTNEAEKYLRHAALHDTDEKGSLTHAVLEKIGEEEYQKILNTAPGVDRDLDGALPNHNIIINQITTYGRFENKGSIILMLDYCSNLDVFNAASEELKILAKKDPDKESIVTEIQNALAKRKHKVEGDIASDKKSLTAKTLDLNTDKSGLGPTIIVLDEKHIEETSEVADEYSKEVGDELPAPTPPHIPTPPPFPKNLAVSFSGSADLNVVPKRAPLKRPDEHGASEELPPDNNSGSLFNNIITLMNERGNLSKLTEQTDINAELNKIFGENNSPAFIKADFESVSSLNAAILEKVLSNIHLNPSSLINDEDSPPPHEVLGNEVGDDYGFFKIVKMKAPDEGQINIIPVNINGKSPKTPYYITDDKVHIMITETNGQFKFDIGPKDPCPENAQYNHLITVSAGKPPIVAELKGADYRTKIVDAAPAPQQQVPDAILEAQAPSPPVLSKPVVASQKPHAVDDITLPLTPRPKSHSNVGDSDLSQLVPSSIPTSFPIGLGDVISGIVGI